MKISNSKVFICFGLLLLALSIPIIGSAVTSPKSSQITADNINYAENNAYYLLKNGDLISHWTITDEGVRKVKFPIELPNPNSTTSAIEDAQINLLIVETIPSKQDIGIFASQYGGFMQSELPNNQWEYGFSHLRLEIIVNLDNITNQSSANSWVMNIVTNLQEKIPGITFLQFENNTYQNTWTTAYRAFPSNFDNIWQIVYSNITFGETLLSNQTRFENADQKAIYISARWDEYETPQTADIDESDLRWEYDVYIELFEPKIIQVQDSGITSVNFATLLKFDGDLLIPTWVNTSNLDVYLYKGAIINEIYPATNNDVQNRGLIHRDMERSANMLGLLSDTAHFNFTNAQQSEPLLEVTILVNTTTIIENEDVLFTAIIENVGDQTAYNIDFEQNYQYPLVSPNNFNNLTGNFVPLVNQLNSGEKIILNQILRCNHNNSWYREYQFDITFDAISNPNLINHWSRPQNQDRFTVSSNRVRLCINPQGQIQPIPWLILNYSISDFTVQVGDVVTLNAEITNIGDINATNIVWNFNPFPDWGNLDSYIGINQSNDQGIIERLNSGDSILINTTYKVDAFHRYFGGNCEWSVDLTYKPENNTSTITQNSEYFDGNDNGISTFLIYPAVGQIFGPYIHMDANFTKKEYNVGDILTIEYYLINIGTTPAYNLQFGASYREGNQEFYIEWFSGINNEFNLGQLNPGENISFTIRYRLLKTVPMYQLSVCPFVQYSSGFDYPLANLWIITTPNQIQPEVDLDKSLSSETIWMIVTFSVIGVCIIETAYLIKLRKRGL